MDIISYLPHEIRNHILSFLPTEDAIRTSILSTQWRKVTSTLSTFNFYRRDNGEDFNNFVTQTLSLHDDSDIEKFEISSLNIDDSFVSHISDWISFAVTHNVRTLQLMIFTGEIENLPFCLFTCKTLTTLTLCSVNLVSPMVVKLPSLKVCMFFSVKFSEESLTNTFFSNCPLLEDLNILNCSFINHNKVAILSPNLKILETLLCLLTVNSRFVLKFSIKLYIEVIQDVLI
ncbi:hypothetical protein AQUCO_02200158v1 [Aquilegia coerulea]|uniref:F-box domain-containing protein n=1 Tax=Aquilegia coerulea TaxID=218851 RepID=A0A2G5DDI9_AQUCA|nr:hypothetical protein AQUCO_02200158v1 [Aquilegia coerulea]